MTYRVPQVPHRIWHLRGPRETSPTSLSVSPALIRTDFLGWWMSFQLYSHHQRMWSFHSGKGLLCHTHIHFSTLTNKMSCSATAYLYTVKCMHQTILSQGFTICWSMPITLARAWSKIFLVSRDAITWMGKSFRPAGHLHFTKQFLSFFCLEVCLVGYKIVDYKMLCLSEVETHLIQWAIVTQFIQLARVAEARYGREILYHIELKW